MNKFDEFLEKTGIKLNPYQKEFLQHVINGERCYVIFPHNSGREMLKRLVEEWHNMEGR